jgi:hypothetical protein
MPCLFICYLSSLFLYFVNQISLFGIHSFCRLPYLVCLACDQNKIFYSIGVKQAAARHNIPVESDGGDLLRLGWSVLW